MTQEWKPFKTTHLTRGAGAWMPQLAWLSMLVLGLSMTSSPVVHHDLWHEMALAREVVRTSAMPLQDPFAYTSTVRPMIDHEWGAGLVGLFVVRMGGGLALGLFNACILGSALLLLALRLRADSVPLPLALATAAVSIASGVLGTPPVAAQAYSVLACSLLLLLLRRDEAGGRWWIALWLAVCALWVNLHGGLVVGFAILGSYAIEQAARGRPWTHLAATMAGMAAVVSLTPYGLGYYRYILETLTMPRPIIVEWNPRWLVTEIGFPQLLFLASLCAAIVVAWRTGWRNFEGILMVAVLAAATTRAVKILPFYSLAWTVTVARAISKTKFAQSAERLGAREAGTLSVAFVSAAAVCLVWGSYNRQFWCARIPGSPSAGAVRLFSPAGPVDFLKKHSFRGNVMTGFIDGAYVAWKLHPNVKVGCDGRYDIAYQPEFVESVVHMYRTGDLKTLEDITRRYPTDLVLARVKEPLARKIEEQGKWRMVYEDDGFMLFARPGLSLPYEQRKGEKIVGTIP
ncbi:MAG: hypothetical protein HZB13_21895 [Acidobacteria bacterium]|nr:hypothetical protein [Acidobacteriota bacterium]